MHLGGHEDSLIRNDDLSEKKLMKSLVKFFGYNNVGFQPEEESEMAVPSL